MTEQTNQPYMTEEELRRYVDGRIAAKGAARTEVAPPPKRGFMQRVGRVVNIVLSLAVFSLVIAVLYYIAAQQYRLPLPMNLEATAGVVFSATAVVPAGEVARPSGGQGQEEPAQVRFTPFYRPTDAVGAPEPTVLPQPTLTPTPEVIVDDAPPPIPSPTALPAPGQPGFVESFKPPMQCSPFISYIGGPCDRNLATATALPAPGADGFVQSFK